MTSPLSPAHPKVVGLLLTNPVFWIWAFFAVCAPTGIGIFSYYEHGTALGGDAADYFKQAAGGWFSSQLWLGERPALYPLLIKLAGSNIHNVLAVQDALLIGSTLFATLMLVDALGLSAFISACFSLAFFTLFLSPPVMLSMNLLMAEALHIGLVILLIAAFVNLKRPRILWPIFAILIWLNREDSFAFVVSLIFLTVVENLVLARFEKKPWPSALLDVAFPADGKSRRPYAATLIFSIIFLGLVTSTTLHVGNMELDKCRVADVYQMRYLPDSKAREFFERQGMPDAPELTNLSRVNWFLLTPETIASHPYSEFYKWLFTHGRTAQVKYLLTTPSAFLAPFLPDNGDRTFFDGNRMIIAQPFQSDQSLYSAFTADNLMAIGQFKEFYNLNEIFRVATSLNLTPFTVILFGIVLCLVAAICIGDRRMWRLLELYISFLAMAWIAYHGDGLDVLRHMEVAWVGLSVVTICVCAYLAQQTLEYCRLRMAVK